ncbi:two-component system, NtrC family, response regulator/two-component system, NtrC family, response regulator AtoC [Neorhodopirellula lusitana]|uniref:Two-component system, NtrC family, response regulator/two-component system, NtrC family, response regulator AtoC n=2 Tax=Neorhodopirellula lusitana TaxID=445327 RepID=A0ABY1QJA9_9BACT|nr:two-component system, NtrC family, response regulator/two-component system, NtrC family, response regulator AtoC [Neorhodopirellula lusitana]
MRFMSIENLHILFVDDDEDLALGYVRWFEMNGHRVTHTLSGQDGVGECQKHDFDIAILDWNMPGLSGLELVQRMRDVNPDTEVIVLTAEGSIDNAVESMRRGVFDFLSKPFPMSELERRCYAAMERRNLRRENTQLREVIDRAQPPAPKMLGESRPMQKIHRLIDRVAPTDKPVLIEGESGTGKELVAKAIHLGSPRGHRPIVTVNCAALPEKLVESELFGHEMGAFTGATSAKPGLFEVADGSTLFIDEVGELPLALQPKLLRVLEDGTMRRVGSERERRVDVRIVAATNRHLETEVAEGRFREDLFYRINVLAIDLPPLRKRGDDVGLLIDQFLGDQHELDEDARAALLAYSWPGNVRQLINTIERAKILSDDVILLDDLPSQFESASGGISSEDDVPQGSLISLQREHIKEVLEQENGNKSAAARVLGVERRKLYRMMKQHGLET